MMKRIISFALAIVVLLGLMSAGTVVVSATSAEPTGSAEAAETGLKASDECIRILKEEEGFSLKPYWDYSQYTVGFGTRCPSDMLAYYQQNGITEEEAQVLLENHLTSIELDLNKRIVEGYGLALTQNQFDALVLFSFNCGTGWVFDNDGTLNKALKSGAAGNDLIRAFAVWCNAGGQIKDYLLRRRLSEANMYLNSVYSRTPPENYCYVLYDANGGTASPRSQGYDSNTPVAPYPTATYAGYTFVGWFTEREGGTQVTQLDIATKGGTLYAHWVDSEGNPPKKEVLSVPVTVNANDVNLRKGPGTNYTIVGSANIGDKMTITETASSGTLRWGKFDGGWICLQYTDFDTASQKPAVPEETKPDATEPSTEATEPSTEATKPSTEATKPSTEATKPSTEATKPSTEATKPSGDKTESSSTAGTTTPQEPAGTMGTVRVDSELNVRSGPSTGYAIAGKLKNGDRVQILEQKVNGTMVWGKIKQGWISMDYVTLDSTSNNENAGQSDSGAKWTGTVVNCDQLRLRSGPGTSYSCLGYIKAGEKVAIFEKKTNGSMVWGKVNNGWISLDYVTLDSDSSAGGTSGTGTEAKWTGTIVDCDRLRLRSGPGTSYTCLGYINAGEKVAIFEKRTNGSMVWGKVKNGWISLDYVAIDGENTASSNKGEAVSLSGTVDAEEYLRVRSGPGVNYSIAGYLYPGDKVQITEKKYSGSTPWGKVTKGWICMDYVKLTQEGDTQKPADTQQKEPSKTVKTVTASCLCVRSGPGTGNSIVSYLYYGSKVEITETKKVGDMTWGKISNGWISMDYVS